MSFTSISVEIKNKWSYSPAIPYMPSWCGQGHLPYEFISKSILF